jgi:hypothetical protein
MKLSKSTLLRLAFIGLLATHAGAHAAAGGQMTNLDAEDRAKVMKEKAKRNAIEHRPDAKTERADQTAECGSQQVGNVFTETGVGRGPREVTTIITGDVINIVDARCR